MRTIVVKVLFFLAVLLLLLTGIISCKPGSTIELRKITVILDWVPNTNHTGIYVARKMGFYKEMGLEVEIIQPTEGGAADLIAAGKGDFGISYQEQVTYARTADDPLPIVAIAALIQENTSGFASPKDRGIKTPTDFEGKKYGGWGSPIEVALLKGLMHKYGADYEKLEIVNIGASDFFTSVERDVDFAWIFYGWDGIRAELIGFDLDFMLLQDVDPVLDFYTPLIIANEVTIKNDSDLVRNFLTATGKGYRSAIDEPAVASEIFLSDNSELEADIIYASQRYLSKNYVSHDEGWGFMKKQKWENFSGWMFENGLIGSTLDAKKAYSNEFLPR